MFDFQSKFKRQIEITGLCLSGRPGNPLRTFDLAAMFNVEELTIKRDLLDLRSYGIAIHSRKKEGVIIESGLSGDMLSDLILHYISLNHNNYHHDRSTALLVEKLGSNALSNLVLLQRCIDRSETAEVSYNKTGDKIQKEKSIDPVLIYQAEGSYRIVVLSEGKIKQLLIDKILKVRPTGRYFHKGNFDISALAKYSWKSWLGTDKFCIKLRISKFWADIITPRILAGDQVITKNEDGSIIFQCTVNSLNEIAGWIVSRGEGIEVLEPVELKKAVIQLAEGTLANY